MLPSLQYITWHKEIATMRLLIEPEMFKQILLAWLWPKYRSSVSSMLQSSLLHEIISKPLIIGKLTKPICWWGFVTSISQQISAFELMCSKYFNFLLLSGMFSLFPVNLRVWCFNWSSLLHSWSYQGSWILGHWSLFLQIPNSPPAHLQANLTNSET